MSIPMILVKDCPEGDDGKHKLFKAAEMYFPIQSCELHLFVSFHNSPDGEYRPCGSMIVIEGAAVERRHGQPETGK